MTDIRYIYRLEPQPNGHAPPEDVTLLTLVRASAGLAHFGLLRRELGWTAAVRAVLKLATHRRAFFGFVHEDGFVSSLWATEHSPRYPIEAGTCVLGPLLTQTDMRGRGFATSLLRATGGCLARLGYRAMYIDTTPDNIASQRAIVRAGFVPYAVLRGERVRKLPRAGMFRKSGRTNADRAQPD